MGMALGCAALAALTLFFVFHVDPSAVDQAPRRSRLDQLMERRDTIYDNLRDLQFEYRTGKFSKKDYQDMKIALEGEAAGVLAEMDWTTGAEPTPASLQAARRGHA
jgi:hypothetical protein